MSKMFKKVFVVSLCLISGLIYSQSRPAGPIIPTPNAASLGMYGEVPVSYFTGLPTIDVPIYTINERGLNLPIGMSYHAQGFRPDVHPSWVGANWSLNFGGAITRKMNHHPDEWKSDEYAVYGYYYNYNRLNNGNWSSIDTLAIMNHEYAYYQRKLDREPDEFSFNFLNFSGKFYLDHLGKWRVQSNKNLRVVFDEVDMINPFFHNTVPASTMSIFKPKVFGKFTLIDDAGIKYIFGKNGNTDGIEYSSSITPPGFNYRLWLIATSWYLVEIQLPDGTGSINIGYERGPFQSSFQYFESQNRFFVSRCTPGINGTSNFDAKGLSGSITSPVYANSISTTSGVRVDFSYSKSNELAYSSDTYLEVFRDDQGRLPSQLSPPSGIPLEYFNFMQARNEVPYYVSNNIWADGVISNNKFAWFKLDSLKISNYDHNNNMANSIFKRVVFNYRENIYERLKLLSLDFKGSSASNEIQKYSFTYNDWGPAAPAYVTDLTDHWGFANSKPLKRDPGYGGYAWFGGSMLSNRAPDETSTKMDILTEITYPTGGKSSFEYEMNTYGKYLMINTRSVLGSSDGVAGGLRVKKITNNDGLGNIDSREYFYVSGYNPNVSPGTLTSSGILDGKPNSNNYNYSLTVNGTYLSLYSSNSIVPMSANSGALCGYSEVAEKFKDGSYKVYKFTNHDNGYGDHDAINTVTPYELGVPYRSKGFERGKPLSEDCYSTANTLVKRTEYTYTRIGAGTDSNFVRSLNKEYGGYCTSLLPPSISPYIGQIAMGFQVPMWNGFYIAPESFNPVYTTATSYGHYVYKFLPEKVTQKMYPSNGQLNAVVITETTNQYDPYGNLIKTIAIDSKGGSLSSNFKYPYNFSGTAVYDAMVARYMNGVIIESDSYRGTTLQEKEYTDYDFFNGTSLIKPRYIRKQIGTNPSFITTKFNQYDYLGNILEMEGIDGVKTSYVWSYFRTRPVAKVIGSDYGSISPLLNQQVLSAPLQGGHSQLLAEVDNLRVQLPNAYVTTFLYESKSDWEPMQIKDPNANSVYYDYDNIGRLIHVRDNESNILKKTEYQYLAEYSFPYKNIEMGTLFNRTTCSPGYAGALYYSIPAGKYGSFISQADANQKAQDDITANGQIAANSIAPCNPYYSYVACCGWSCVYSNFSLTGTGTVNFSLVVYKNSGGGSVYNAQIGNLNGLLFLPSSSRNINFTSGSIGGMITIMSNGEVRMTNNSSSGTITINGSYTL